MHLRWFKLADEPPELSGEYPLGLASGHTFGSALDSPVSRRSMIPELPLLRLLYPFAAALAGVSTCRCPIWRGPLSSQLADMRVRKCYRSSGCRPRARCRRSRAIALRQVFPPGRSFHGAPERKTQRMPFRIRRSSTRGISRCLFGRRGWMICHQRDSAEE